MTIRWVKGDLFDNEFNAQAFAHGCNCIGAMGAGIASLFRIRYPSMYREYRNRCLSSPRQFNPGDVFFWSENSLPSVFNLATQEDTRYWRATETNIYNCLRKMLVVADEEGIQSIALPRIGAGLGKLSWTRVRTILEGLPQWDGTLYVYEQFIPKGDKN